MLGPANIERIPTLQHGDLLIDPQCCTATLAGKVLQLFPKEFETLYLLAQYPNWVLSPRQIYEHVWKEDPVDCDHIVRNTICQLRRKLARPELIQMSTGTAATQFPLHCFIKTGSGCIPILPLARVCTFALSQ